MNFHIPILLLIPTLLIFLLFLSLLLLMLSLLDSLLGFTNLPFIWEIIIVIFAAPVLTLLHSPNQMTPLLIAQVYCILSLPLFLMISFLLLTKPYPYPWLFPYPYPWLFTKNLLLMLKPYWILDGRMLCKLKLRHCRLITHGLWLLFHLARFP